MQNNINLTQAIEQLKREVQRETSELQQKEASEKASITEKSNLENLIKAKEAGIKQKEDEIKKFRTEISQARSKISETERNTRKLTEEVTKLRREQAAKSQELTRVQNEYQTTLKNSGVKFRI